MLTERINHKKNQLTGAYVAPSQAIPFKHHRLNLNRILTAAHHHFD